MFKLIVNILEVEFYLDHIYTAYIFNSVQLIMGNSKKSIRKTIFIDNIK